MKAFPALLALVLCAAHVFGAPEPEAPQTPPILYDQLGDLYILRIDNRRYQMPKATKTPVAELLAAANHPRTKLLFEEYKRVLADKAAADTTIRRAQSGVDREVERVVRLQRSLESLRAQLSFLRLQPVVDVREILFLQEQIRLATLSLASAEAQEAKARTQLDRTQGAAEAAFVRADKARDAYVAALTDYEKPLAQIRALAMSLGTAL